MKKIEISALAFNQNDFINDAIKFKNNQIMDLHYDVMDNIFVPNTSFPNLENLDFLIENGFNISIHLMVKDVESYLKKVVYKNVKYITFHCESQSVSKSIEFIRFIRSKNIKAGIAIKPKTNLDDYKDIIKISDIITVMSVEPGFGGQSFIEGSDERVRQIKKIAKNNVIIQIDGGINEKTLQIVKNDCNLFVSGSFLYKNIENYNDYLKLIADKSL